MIQYGLFRRYAEYEVTWAYPSGFDQCSYLTYSYDDYEQIRSAGLIQGVKNSLRRPVPNGLMLPLQANLLFFLLGPSRLSALTLNFAYFALFQTALVTTLRWLTGRWSVACLGLGLLLAVRTPMYGCGGIMDFRIDFIAFCLFGTVLCLVVRSGGFLSRRWALAAAAAVVLLVLFRFLTFVYLAEVFASCRGFLAALWLWQRNDPVARAGTLRRLGGLLLAGGAVLAATLPMVAWKWSMIRTYYLGQFGNGEAAIRRSECGVDGLSSRGVFYLRSLLSDHAGRGFLSLAALCLVVTLALALARRATLGRRPGPALGSAGLPFAVLALLGPLAALVVFGAPSPVAAGIVVGPLVWVVLLTALCLLEAPSRWGPATCWGVGVLAAAVLAVGAFAQADRLARRGPLDAHRADAEETVQVYDEIGRLSRRQGWAAPRVSFTTISDHLWCGLLAPTVYERLGLFVHFQGTSLGGGILAVSPAQALAAISESDFVVLTTDAPWDEVSPYPFIRSMHELRPQLQEACERSLVPVRRFHLYDQDVVLYMRPAPRLEGVTIDHWISSAGLTLTVDGAWLKSRPRIELSGHDDFAILGATPAVRAELVAPGQPPLPLRAGLTRNGPEYRISVETPHEAPAAATEVQVHLTFDGYFVPSERPAVFGPSDDRRRLVMRAPDAAVMLPGPQRGEMEWRGR